MWQGARTMWQGARAMWQEEGRATYRQEGYRGAYRHLSGYIPYIPGYTLHIPHAGRRSCPRPAHGNTALTRGLAELTKGVKSTFRVTGEI